MDFFKIKSFCASKGHNEESGKNPKNEKKCAKIIYLIRNLYLDYIKNDYNLIIKRQRTEFKMDKESEQTSFQRKCVNGQ